MVKKYERRRLQLQDKSTHKILVKGKVKVGVCRDTGDKDNFQTIQSRYNIQDCIARQVVDGIKLWVEFDVVDIVQSVDPKL